LRVSVGERMTCGEKQRRTDGAIMSTRMLARVITRMSRGEGPGMGRGMGRGMGIPHCILIYPHFPSSIPLLQRGKVQLYHFKHRCDISLIPSMRQA
jgi:hypothetical protein